MKVELAQVAAGLPLALSFAIAGGIATLREGRRRTALNEALHELRRPLQVLSLSLTADRVEAGALKSSLHLAVVALERLDLEINGEAAEGSRRAVSMRLLAEEAERRWGARAALAGSRLRVRCGSPRARVVGDENELAQALDNLISNAIEHGGPEVAVELRERDGFARLAVLDSGGGTSGPPSRGAAGIRSRISGRRRRGHGLRVVERTALEHGGRFRLRRGEAGAEALLELPLLREPG
jgi:signal transduction histidine kinase